MKQKKRNKPFYKQFLKLRQNIQNRPKIFKFKKQKWNSFQQFSKKSLKFYKRFKVKDQTQLVISKFASKGNSFKKTYKNNLRKRKIFSLFYGGLKKKCIKNNLRRLLNSNKNIDLRLKTLQLFESRLDTVLYRAGFSLSIKGAGQLILHGHVLVNNQIVKTKSYLLKKNDLIEIGLNEKSRELVKKNLDRFNFWPIPPKHLLVNFKTLQILFLYSNNDTTLPIFNHYIDFNSMISSIRQY